MRLRHGTTARTTLNASPGAFPSSRGTRARFCRSTGLLSRLTALAHLPAWPDLCYRGTENSLRPRVPCAARPVKFPADDSGKAGKEPHTIPDHKCDTQQSDHNKAMQACIAGCALGELAGGA
jgi:hypothetical protein